MGWNGKLKEIKGKRWEGKGRSISSPQGIAAWQTEAAAAAADWRRG